MKIVDRYVEEALLESTTSYFDSGTSGVIAINGERKAILRISAIEKLVQDVVATNENVVSIHEAYGGKQVVKLSGVGKRLLANMWCRHEIQRYYPIHDFSPLVNVFFQATEEHAFQYYSQRNPNSFHGDLHALVDSINLAVDRVRKLVRGAVFRKQLNAHRRLSNKNYKSLLAYIEAIFKETSRVMVLRVDLGYSKLVGVHGVRQVLGFEDVKLHRERLMGILRRKTKGAFLGHAWKLEYGLSKGYHYHCMFFLDGSQVREDIGWARTIGEIWADKATQGRGVYYNCNRRKDAYRACGIGMIEHFDKDKRKNLQKAALYLTKIEYYLRIATEGRARTFGRGEMPKPAVKKRGRPRRRPAIEI